MGMEKKKKLEKQQECSPKQDLQGEGCGSSCVLSQTTDEGKEAEGGMEQKGPLHQS